MSSLSASVTYKWTYSCCFKPFLSVGKRRFFIKSDVHEQTVNLQMDVNMMPYAGVERGGGGD